MWLFLSMEAARRSARRLPDCWTDIDLSGDLSLIHGFANFFGSVGVEQSRDRMDAWLGGGLMGDLLASVCTASTCLTLRIHLVHRSMFRKRT